MEKKHAAHCEKNRKVRLWAENGRQCPSYLTSSTAFVLAIKAEQRNVFLLWCGCTYTGLTTQLKKKNSSCWVTAYFISSFSICEGSYQRKQMTKDIRWLLCWSLSTQNLLFYSCENLFNFKTDQCLFICQNECNCSFPYCKLHKADRKIHC